MKLSALALSYGLPRRPNRADNATPKQGLAIGLSGILRTAIGMVDATRWSLRPSIAALSAASVRRTSMERLIA